MAIFFGDKLIFTKNSSTVSSHTIHQGQNGRIRIVTQENYRKSPYRFPDSCEFEAIREFDDLIYALIPPEDFQKF